MKSIVIGLGLTTIAAIAILVAGGDEPKAEPAQVRVDQTSAQETRRELEDLKKKLAALDEAQSRMAGDLAAKPKAAEKPAAEVEEEKGAQESSSPAPAPLPTLEQHLAGFETAIETDAIDPEWSPVAEQELKSTVNKLSIPGVTLEETSCKKTICKMKLALGEGNPGVELHRALFGAIKWRAPRFLYVDGDTTFSAVAYFAREGHALPAPEL